MAETNGVHVRLCEMHPRYRARNKPNNKCEECWRAWLREYDALRALNAQIAAVMSIEAEPPPPRLVSVPLLCGSQIPGHHLEECCRRDGHAGECSSSAMDYNT